MVKTGITFCILLNEFHHSNANEHKTKWNPRWQEANCMNIRLEKKETQKIS